MSDSGMLGLLFPEEVLDSDDEELTEGDIREQDESDPNALKIVKVDLNVIKNSIPHHTDKYYEDEEFEGCVLRRGQPFDIDITFNKPYNEKEDDLKLSFRYVFTMKKVSFDLVLSDKDEPGKWGAKVMSKKDKTITVRIYTPVTLYIGEWKFMIDVIKKVDNKTIGYRFNHEQKIFMIFNPWCKDDLVFMPKENDAFKPCEESLNEYVLNDTGKVYKSAGLNRSVYPPKPVPFGKTWNFAQFDHPVLECVVGILYDNYLALEDRADPVKISRKLSSLSNRILGGRWSEPYDGEGARKPWEWNGSLEILKKYHEDKNTVKYGQCWVFSGLLLTMARTLGIPAKSVTNYGSAHDTDNTLTIDYYRNEKGELLKDKCTDSIWNFHVWNQVWMERLDLPKGYGGWQAFDGTPQELSDYAYQCGPASLKAIKEGNTKLPYDTAFIYAEVNADSVTHYKDKNGAFTISKLTSKNKVGKLLMTQKPLHKKKNRLDDDEDVTQDYKYKEGSALERVVFQSAYKNNRGMKPGEGSYLDNVKEDVDFQFTLTGDTSYGKDFGLKCTAKNNSKKTRTVTGMMKANTIYYMGTNFMKIKRQDFDQQRLEPGKSFTVEMAVTFEDYRKKLTDQCYIKGICAFRVWETDQVYFEDLQVALTKPELSVSAPDKVKVGQQFLIKLSFVNPLPEKLTKCVVKVEGLKDIVQINEKDVKPGGKFEAEVMLTPKTAGPKKIIASVDCNEIDDVNGDKEILVEKVK